MHVSSCDWHPEWFGDRGEETSAFLSDFATMFSERVCALLLVMVCHVWYNITNV